MNPAIPVPSRIEKLPKDQRGYHVPWFVAKVDGVYDFRVIEAQKVYRAVREKRCWVCGDETGKFVAFVIGPMCAINRVSSEPPSHRECATYSVKVCPFLTQPKMERRETNLPEEGVNPAGEMIRRNPGVSLLWVTKNSGEGSWFPFDAGNGVLFNVGEPVELEWYAEGRTATPEEISASIDSGLPILSKMAAAEGDEAVKALAKQVEAARKLIPA